ncbi:MAG: hypothetical protein HOQ09_06590 [Gemmatimonadaceae bacterium]|nr:hypothetical protein [Gemmatimonadaceae bacterium]
MADWTRRSGLTESERPSGAVPPRTSAVVPVGTPRTLRPALAPPLAFPLSLSVAIGACGAALALGARTLVTTFAGPLPYDPPSTIYTLGVSFLAAAVAVGLTAWAPNPTPALPLIPIARVASLPSRYLSWRSRAGSRSRPSRRATRPERTTTRSAPP